MKAKVVIPTCRDLSFLEGWKDTDLINQHLIVVEDKYKPTCELPVGWDITRYTHTDIEDDLKEKSWIIPKGDGGIKSYGLYKAYQDNPDFVVCLDDDVWPLTPTDQFVNSHKIQLDSESHNTKWFNQIIDPDVYPRGYPVTRGQRNSSKIVFNMGLWKDNPDLSAFEFFKPDYDRSKDLSYLTGVISYGKYFCLSAMNMAFKKEVIPAFYQMLMGDQVGVYRYDDVWSGMIMKKIADHLGYSVSMGLPMVVHKKKSDEKKSLQKEIHGMTLHEILWPFVDDIELTGTNWSECYLQISSEIHSNAENPYFKKLGQAMTTWTELFD